jgi:hypothetical protein
MYASYEVAREQQADRRRRAQAHRQAGTAARAGRGARRTALAVVADAIRSALRLPGAATPQAQTPRG